MIAYVIAEDELPITYKPLGIYGGDFGTWEKEYRYGHITTNVVKYLSKKIGMRVLEYKPTSNGCVCKVVRESWMTSIKVITRKRTKLFHFDERSYALEKVPQFDGINPIYKLSIDCYYKYIDMAITKEYREFIMSFGEELFNTWLMLLHETYDKNMLELSRKMFKHIKKELCVIAFKSCIVGPHTYYIF